jgi:hypothetical protein
VKCLGLLSYLLFFFALLHFFIFFGGNFRRDTLSGQGRALMCVFNESHEIGIKGGSRAV